MGHPGPGPDGPAADPRCAGRPVLHLGPVAAGRGVALDDSLRQEFAYKNGVLCYDSELDSVVESVYGNRKDHYILVRGIADYKVGLQRYPLPLSNTVYYTGRDEAEGVAALRRADGRQRRQVHHPEYTSRVRAALA